MDRKKLIDYLKDHTNKEAAEYFGVTRRTVSWNLNRMGSDYYSRKYDDLPKQLSEIQMNLVEGTLLGGGGIDVRGRYYFSDSDKNLIETYRNLLNPFSAGTYENVTAKMNTSETSVRWFVKTICSPVFVEIRKKWYPDGKKRVPIDLILRPGLINYWFEDKGFCYPRERIVLFRSSFGESEVQTLAQKLSDFGIDSTCQKDGSKYMVRVSNRKYDTLMRLLGKEVGHEVRQGWGAGKLSAAKATEIRRIYSTGQHTQKDIAQKYGVNLTTIWKVINNVTYPEKYDIGFGGTATVELILNLCTTRT